MDKETLSNYGWIVICVLVLAVMLAFATPFGTFIADGFKATYTGLFQTGDSALDVGLNAVGVSNKLPCGHGRKEAGDHSQKECGHYNCQDTDCGCVPASCGIEGHWSGDGKDHTSISYPYHYNYVTQEYRGQHKYNCQCAEAWTVPDGGTYITEDGVTYNSGDVIPCGVFDGNDVYLYGDYKYVSYNMSGGWKVELNLDVTDKKQTYYGEIVEYNINGSPVTGMPATFIDCTALIEAPKIPSTVANLNNTFCGCTSLEIPPDLTQNQNISTVHYCFINCSALKENVRISCSAIDKGSICTSKVEYVHHDGCGH